MKKITLREISRADIVDINKWRKDRLISDPLGGTFRYLDVERDERWFDEYLNNRDQVRCAICIEDSDKPVGVVYLTGIDRVNRSAEFSIMIGDQDHHEKGIGTLATNKMLEHAFLDLNLNRIFLTVLEDNSAALGLYKKIGFVKEGVLRQAAYKNGVYKNLILMSILNEQFREEHGR